MGSTCAIGCAVALMFTGIFIRIVVGLPTLFKVPTLEFPSVKDSVLEVAIIPCLSLTKFLISLVLVELFTEAGWSGDGDWA